MQTPTESILHLLIKTNSLLEGHFLLSSGLHSPKYLQCARVLQYPAFSEELGRQIAERFKADGIGLVCAPALGGIIIGHEVSRVLGTRFVFFERERGKMALRRGFEIKRGERVLVVEDVITTGGSIREIIQLVEGMGGVVGGVGSLVDRSGGEAEFDCKTESLFTLKILTYEATECPLCKAGLPIEKPGSRTL
jgi:orotate phosphoribosyltransferase